MILQLHPAVPLWHLPTAQACQAVALIDYSAEHDLLWVVIRADGEIWTVPNKDLRGQQNVTLGRDRQTTQLDMIGNQRPCPIEPCAFVWPPNVG